MRPKVCKQCGVKFIPERHMQATCGIPCAIDYGRKQSAKAERIAQAQARKIIKIKRDKLKTVRDWTKEAQIAFNAFIRERDKNEPCISCGRHHQGQYHAGHYRTVGAHPELRFNEDNCSKQCSVCNNHRHGNIVEYRISLLSKIGKDKLEWLEGNHEPAKYTVDDYKRIKAEYKAKLKELKNA